jgi:hypothetical protein
MDLSRSGSRRDFRPLRFNLKPQTLASFGHGGMAPQPACLAGSTVLPIERVAPPRVVFPARFPPDRRQRRRGNRAGIGRESGGNVLGLRGRANCKTHSPSEASSLGSNYYGSRKSSRVWLPKNFLGPCHSRQARIHLLGMTCANRALRMGR